MKYKNEFLILFKEFLHSYCRSEETAKNYFQWIRSALKDQEFNSILCIDYVKLKKFGENLKLRKYFVQFTRTCDLFEKCFPGFQSFDTEYKALRFSKRKRRLTLRDEFDLVSAIRKLNKIKNKKVSVAFKFQLISALRISELERIKKENITFTNEGRIKISNLHGKGGVIINKVCLKDIEVEKSIKEILRKLNTDTEKLFYSKSYLRKFIDFESHDIRRAAAQLKYFQLKKKYKNDEKILCELKEFLSHSKNSRIYKKYLSRKIYFGKIGKKYE